MDFLKSSKRRTLASELAYFSLNIGLAVAILVVVRAIESPLPAFAIILLSKWRVLAVRPRYWASNIKANLVDTIVGLSVVVLLYVASGALIAQVAMTILYAVWLLVIKPRSKREFVAAQAGVAVFLGVSALMTISYNWMSSAVVVFMWIIGYSVARHVQTSYEEPHRSFYSLTWGLVLAELGWLGYHWNFAYALPGFGELKISQTALITLAICFLAECVYSSYRRHGTVRSSDVMLPSIFSIGTIFVILLFFNMSFDSGTF